MNLDDKRLNCECGQKLPEYLGSFSYPRFCPRCGKMLSEDATKYMGYLTTDEEIKSIVLEELLDVVERTFMDGDKDIVSEDDEGKELRHPYLDIKEWDFYEIAEKCFESQNNSGAFFCSNYQARLFERRHEEFVDAGITVLEDAYGDAVTPVLLNDRDKLLVWLFLEAARDFLKNVHFKDNFKEPKDLNEDFIRYVLIDTMREWRPFDEVLC